MRLCFLFERWKIYLFLECCLRISIFSKIYTKMHETTYKDKVKRGGGFRISIKANNSLIFL